MNPHFSSQTMQRLSKCENLIADDKIIFTIEFISIFHSFSSKNAIGSTLSAIQNDFLLTCNTIRFVFGLFIKVAYKSSEIFNELLRKGREQRKEINFLNVIEKVNSLLDSEYEDYTKIGMKILNDIKENVSESELAIYDIDKSSFFS